MRNIARAIFSNQLTVVALFFFGVAMACATFIENDYGTRAVRSLIYEAWWFELLMGIIVLNFIGNIKRYRLWRKEKYPILLFHVAFLVIIAGAFITRYFGYEGTLNVREGAQSNQLVSANRYLSVSVAKAGYEKSVERKYNASIFSSPSVSYSFGSKELPLQFTTQQFIPHAVQTLAPGKSGQYVLELVVTDGSGRKDLFLESGKDLSVAGHIISFNQSRVGAINLSADGDSLYCFSPVSLQFIQMGAGMAGQIASNKKSAIQPRALYQTETFGFVVKTLYEETIVDFVPAEDKEMGQGAADLLKVRLTCEDEEIDLTLAATDGVSTMPQIARIKDYQVSINYGPKLIELPFSIFLEDFQLERYPGSTSPSSYASEVKVIDQDNTFRYRIFMNNVLDYKGYRFFQASYDTDEQGTVLSVNRDFWGTQVTYLGYILLTIGMIWTLFGSKSRFQEVYGRLNRLQGERKPSLASILLVISLLSGSSSLAKPLTTNFVIDRSHIIPLEQAAKFGELLVQDMDGRIKPLNTLTSELTRKLYRSSRLKVGTVSGEALNSDQVFLSMIMDPYYWQGVPLIKVDQKKGKPILEWINCEGKNYLSFNDLVDESGSYLLAQQIEESGRKKPAQQNELDKEIIKIDERFNILYQALEGYYLKIFPKKGDPRHQWYDVQIQGAGFDEEDELFVSSVLPMYFQSVNKAQTTGDWSESDKNLEYIATYQNVLGSEVNPSMNRRKAELIYNRLQVFNRIFPIYMLMGIGALVLAIIRVFYSRSSALKVINKILSSVLIITFLLQTFNMLLRWYAGGYPPWSNGYEMIILVAWFLMLFGFLFTKKSNFALPVSAIFSGVLMFVAFLDWLNPEITNLVPVLKSYWLKIHVAVIVGSYAPLALSALLGILVLCFMIFPKAKKLDRSISELTLINELSMTIGLFMLAIGTFLGGVWANESWGRYWGWDPKETWALISIIIYTIVLHLRLIPKLRSAYIFNLSSVFAFYSIIMTSFGVNYYLSGLHSYAKGDPLPIPSFVYWVTGSLLLISAIAWHQNKDKKKGLEFKKVLNNDEVASPLVLVPN